MHKHFFIHLLFMALLVFLVAQLSMAFVFSSWTSYQVNIEQHLMSGEVSLLADELNAVADDQQAQWLTSIQKEYGVYSVIAEIDDVFFSPHERTLLANGDVVFHSQHAAAYQLLTNGRLIRVDSVDHAIDNDQLMHDLGVVGFLSLLSSQLAPETEQARRDKVDKRFDQNFIAITIQTVEDTILSQEDKVRLLSGEVVKVDTEQSMHYELPGDFFYKKLDASSDVIKVGPISAIVKKNSGFVVIVFYASIGLLIAASIGVAFVPTWISSTRLDYACRRIQQGDISERVTPFFGSYLNRLSGLFNEMADQLKVSFDKSATLRHAISHELRTPLMSLSFSLELLANNKSNTSKKIVMDRLKASVKELKDLSTELNDYAQFERETITLNIQSHNLNDFLMSCIQTWRSFAGDINVSLAEIKQPCQLRYDEYYLKRVIDNLFRNGLVYADSCLYVRVKSTQEYGYIIVENDGVAIPDADKQRIFDPFIRLDHSRHKMSGGTGVGLAICKHIVQAHHGSIWVEDSDLGGAKFIIRLPTIS